MPLSLTHVVNSICIIPRSDGNITFFKSKIILLFCKLPFDKSSVVEKVTLADDEFKVVLEVCYCIFRRERECKFDKVDGFPLPLISGQFIGSGFPGISIRCFPQSGGGLNSNLVCMRLQLPPRSMAVSE